MGKILVLHQKLLDQKETLQKESKFLTQAEPKKAVVKFRLGFDYGGRGTRYNKIAASN